MWIEKDIKHKHTQGGALSKQVNSEIETLKKDNNLLFINNNILSDMKNKNYKEKLHKHDPNECTKNSVKGSETKEDYTNGANKTQNDLSINYFNQSINFNNVHNKKKITNECYENRLKEKNFYNGNMTTCNKLKLCINNEEENEFFNTYNSMNLKHTKELYILDNNSNGLIEKSTNIKDFKNNDEYNLNGSHFRHNNNSSELIESNKFNKKQRKMENREIHKNYKNTQYLNGSLCNDSIVSNNTVLYYDRSNNKKNDMTGDDWNFFFNKGRKTEPKDKEMHTNCYKSVKNANNDLSYVKMENEQTNHEKNNNIQKVKCLIQKDIPIIIKKTIDSHLSKNIDIKVQESIEKNIMSFIEDNLFSIIEKNLNNLNSNSIYDKINETINNEIKKNIDLVYMNVKDNTHKNIKEEITKNFDFLNNSINVNINKKIDNDIEEIYAKVNKKVDAKLDTHLSDNIYSSQELILKNLNDELKRKMEIIRNNINDKVNESINKELVKNIETLNYKINENINKELKKNIDILNRNIDENLNDQIEKNINIMHKNMNQNINEEIKNNINTIEKSIDIIHKNIDVCLNEQIEKKIIKIHESMHSNSKEEIKKMIEVIETNMKENISNEIKKNIEIINDNIDKNIKQEFKKNLDLPQKDHNEAISEELKKCIHALNKSFDSNLDEKIDKKLDIVIQDLNGKLKEEIIEKIQIVHEDINSNVNDKIKVTVSKLYENIKLNLNEEIKKNVNILQEVFNFNFAAELKKNEIENAMKNEMLIKTTSENVCGLLKNNITNIIQKELKLMKIAKPNNKDINEFINNKFSVFQKKFNNSLESNTEALLNINEIIVKNMNDYILRINDMLSKNEKNTEKKITDKIDDSMTKIIDGVCKRNSEDMNKIVGKLENKNNKYVANMILDIVEKEHSFSKTDGEKIFSNLHEVVEKVSNIYDEVKTMIIEQDKKIKEYITISNNQLDLKLDNQNKRILKMSEEKLNEIINKNFGYTQDQEEIKSIEYKKKFPLKINSSKANSNYSTTNRNRCLINNKEMEIKKPEIRLWKDVDLDKYVNSVNYSNKKITIENKNKRKRKPVYVVNYVKNESNELIEISEYLKKKTKKKVYY